jgi:hypothetical protein
VAAAEAAAEIPHIDCAWYEAHREFLQSKHHGTVCERTIRIHATR